MKGATALPWVTTISPPNKNIIMIIGKSQNFFLTRIKRHNSFIKDIVNFLELVSHTFDRWLAGWCTFDPVTFSLMFKLKVQRSFPH